MMVAGLIYKALSPRGLRSTERGVIRVCWKISVLTDSDNYTEGFLAKVYLLEGSLSDSI